jgi:hypothetical protein
LFAKGFEFSESESFSVELLTCFETFEHFVDPVEEMDNFLCISRKILLPTEFVLDPAHPPGEWRYYGVEHGQ